METSTPTPDKKPSLINKVEAILFSIGARISVKDITRLARSREENVLEALRELKRKYEEKETSLFLVEDGDYWKLSVRDSYLPVVKKIVTETELSKSVLETLAIIAFKYPILQSDLIHLRTNKAYDHLKELEQHGFISRKKHGRTNLIKLTEKFFQYFDLPPDKLKGQFSDFDSIAHAIERKEEELHARKEQQAQELEDISAKEDRIKQEIEALDSGAAEKPEGVQVYGGGKETDSGEEKFPILEEKLGNLGVYEEPRAEENTDGEGKPDAVEIYDEKPSQKQDGDSDTEEESQQAKEEQGIKVTPDMEKEIDKRVEEMLRPSQDSKDGDDDPSSSPAGAADNDELEDVLDEAKKKREDGQE